MSCLKPSPSTPPKEILHLHDEAVEGDLVFLHAAIAKHLDLGARHAGDYFIYFTSPISWRENLAVIDFERLWPSARPF